MSEPTKDKSCIVYMPDNHTLESFLCSLEQAVDCSEPNCLDGEMSGMSSSMTTANGCCSNELETDCLTTHRSSETCENSWKEVLRKPTEGMSMSCQAGFPANRLALPENNLAQTMSATCGPQLSQSSMRFDPDTASLKTLQLSLIADTSEPSSETWPRAGIVSGGKFYRQQNWERRISEIVFGLLPTPTVGMVTGGQNPEKGGQMGLGYMARKNLWPTPRSSPNENRQTKPTPSQLAGKHGMNLATAVNLWPTPRSQDAKRGAATEWELQSGRNNLHIAVAKQLPTPTARDWRHGSANQPLEKMRLNDTIAHEGNGGQLSPDWVEWLMNWPIGWTSLEPLAPDAVDEWVCETTANVWWHHEHDLPRIANGVPNRTKRLQAIGNGQVAVVAAMAWLILTQDL